MKKELLAPAGDIEAAYAAFYYGADAVYLGLKQFSARATANNFTEEELGELTAFAHHLGKKVFVTINTVLQTSELEDLMKVLEVCKREKVDAVILQDLGVARIVKKMFPELEMHASTQMVVHNKQGALALKNLGFSRVVPRLSRGPSPPQRLCRARHACRPDALPCPGLHTRQEAQSLDGAAETSQLNEAMRRENRSLGLFRVKVNLDRRRRDEPQLLPQRQPVQRQSGGKEEDARGFGAPLFEKVEEIALAVRLTEGDLDAEFFSLFAQARFERVRVAANERLCADEAHPGALEDENCRFHVAFLCLGVDERGAFQNKIFFIKTHYFGRIVLQAFLSSK